MEPTYRRLYRDRDNKIVAGVAAGIAAHLRVRPILVRLIFIALLLVNGLGGVLYAAYWVFVPSASAGGAAPREGSRAVQRVSLVALAIGVIILQSQVSSVSLDPTVAALIVVVVIGAGIIWGQFESQRSRPEPASGRKWLIARVIGGSLLLVGGIIGLSGFLLPSAASTSSLLLGMAFALVALTGVVLVFAPVLLRIFTQLGEERVARIREQERAEVAAVVHDQVLHTLALIQRSSADPIRVQRLARGQERSLRGWLYQTTASPTERLAPALEQTAAEVEDMWGAVVETVIVGDAPHNERMAALVGATREALVNAARHSGAHTVSLYAEVEEATVSVYIRDRGVGFDPAAVDESRQGLRGSIIGRMARHGGTATVRSAPGEGTEIALSMRLDGGSS